ncbi:hypothetical protein LHFGNBLO_002310 [Mesorhizobium sp. AR10]|nr:hypothetical protein LHFGNBLO_002310 [Mesorhizobium sp. AR10]
MPSVAKLALLSAPKAALRGVTKLASRSVAKLASRSVANPASRSVTKATLPGDAKLASRRIVEPALLDVGKPPLPRAARPSPPMPSSPRAPHAELVDAIAASRDSLLDGLFPVTEWPQPPKPQFPRLGKKVDRRSDFVVAALGITLGLICALFPWYIFFNQDQFGVQAIKFGGSGTNDGRTAGRSQMENAGAPLTANDVPDVDLFATGTLQDPTENPPGLDQQPFPTDVEEIRVVHVANGRAMIEDDAGLWVVQRGSKLPDSSVVSSIEQRGGKWVLVTSNDQVIELSK